MNRITTKGSATLAVAVFTAMAAMPTVVKADDVWYTSSNGRRSMYTQTSPYRRTTARVIEYRRPSVHGYYRTPQARTRVRQVTPTVPVRVYRREPVVARVVHTTTPVYVERRVAYAPVVEVRSRRPAIVYAHSPFRPGLRRVWYPACHGSRSWSFDLGFHAGRGPQRGVGFGFSFSH